MGLAAIGHPIPAIGLPWVSPQTWKMRRWTTPSGRSAQPAGQGKNISWRTLHHRSCTGTNLISDRFLLLHRIHIHPLRRQGVVHAGGLLVHHGPTPNIGTVVISAGGHHPRPMVGWNCVCLLYRVGEPFQQRRMHTKHLRDAVMEVNTGREATLDWVSHVDSVRRRENATQTDSEPGLFHKLHKMMEQLHTVQTRVNRQTSRAAAVRISSPTAKLPRHAH